MRAFIYFYFLFLLFEEKILFSFSLLLSRYTVEHENRILAVSESAALKSTIEEIGSKLVKVPYYYLFIFI
jgi:hypothetical protein